MGHGGRTQARLVGEHAPGEALAHGHQNGVAEHAAAHRPEAERLGEDGGQDGGDVGDAQQNDGHARHDIEDGHKGDQVGGHLPDALHAADDHKGGEDGQKDAGVQRGQAHQGLHGPGDLGGLGDVADAEAGDAAQQGEQHRQPLVPRALFNVVHGAAEVGAVPVHLAVLHRQDDLGVLGHHAEEGGHPHPEDRPRPSGEDGPGDAGDVARPHGPGQGGGHRLEGGEVLPAGGLVRLAEQRAQGAAQHKAEFAGLKAPAAGGEIDSRANQQEQHDRTPDDPVDETVDL